MKSARVSELRIRHLYTHTHFYHVRSPCVGVSFAALALAASGATASVATTLAAASEPAAPVATSPLAAAAAALAVPTALSGSYALG